MIILKTLKSQYDPVSYMQYLLYVIKFCLLQMGIIVFPINTAINYKQIINLWKCQIVLKNWVCMDNASSRFKADQNVVWRHYKYRPWQLWFVLSFWNGQKYDIWICICLPADLNLTDIYTEIVYAPNILFTFVLIICIARLNHSIYFLSNPQI